MNYQSIPLIGSALLLSTLSANGQKKNTQPNILFILCDVNPEKPDVPLNKNDAFQKVQKRRVQEKR